MRYLLGFVCVLALGVAFVACGGQEGGCAEPVDVGGEWQMTSTVVVDNCDGRQSQTFPMTITQDGNALTAETSELTFAGTICGNEIQMDGSFPEDGGTVTVNATLLVSTDGNSMEGSDNWTWTDGAETCSGSDSLSGIRIDGGTSTVSGTVLSITDAPPVGLGGATVSVLETSPPIMATSLADGGFTLADVPNGQQFFGVTAAGHWGSVDIADVPDETVGLELSLLSDPIVTEVEEALGRSFDPAEGIVLIAFEGVAGGETGAIDAQSDAPFTFDENGDPVVQNTVIADENDEAMLIFTGVSAASVSATVSATCQIDEDPGTRYPIMARSITSVYALCQ